MKTKDVVLLLLLSIKAYIIQGMNMYNGTSSSVGTVEYRFGVYITN